MGFDLVKAGKDVPNDINVIIEISAQGDPIKFEVDKDSGAVLSTASWVRRCATR